MHKSIRKTAQRHCRIHTTIYGIHNPLQIYVQKYITFPNKKPFIKKLIPLGYAAAFIDALAEGGWGPIVTTTLVANDVRPDKAIGSVNLAQFFVTTTEANNLPHFHRIRKLQLANNPWPNHRRGYLRSDCCLALQKTTVKRTWHTRRSNNYIVKRA